MCPPRLLKGFALASWFSFPLLKRFRPLPTIFKSRCAALGLLVPISACLSFSLPPPPPSTLKNTFQTPLCPLSISPQCSTLSKVTTTGFPFIGFIPSLELYCRSTQQTHISSHLLCRWNKSISKKSQAYFANFVEFRMHWVGLWLQSPLHSLLSHRTQRRRMGKSNPKTALTFESLTPLPNSTTSQWECNIGRYVHLNGNKIWVSGESCWAIRWSVGEADGEWVLDWSGANSYLYIFIIWRFFRCVSIS